jgi:hypothetical protein
MKKTLTFEELWKMATMAANARNGLTYHHCCDKWTSRSAKVSRDSHKQKLQWKNLLSIVDKSYEDKKQALLAKMTEEGWRLPAILNEACDSQSRANIQTQIAFRPHNPDQPPQDLRDVLAPQNLVQTSSDHFTHQELGTN